MFGKKADSNQLGFEVLKDKKAAFKKMEQMILSAEKELFINSNYYLKVFEEELKIAREKGVRIILFSFNTPEPMDIKIEMYCKNFARDDNYDRHISMVVDHSSALIYDEYLKSRTLEVSYITNPTLVKVIGEHIHHDIYFQKIQYLIGGMDITSKVNIESSYEVLKERDTKKY